MDYKDTTIVLPTLNEARNIGKIVNELVHDFQGTRIIIVDDGSVDGTLENAEELCDRFKDVKLIKRGKVNLKKGLTYSIIDGIKASTTKYVIVMDADFQHPLAEISRLHKRLKESGDLVVCVRSEVPGWQTHRKIISKVLAGAGYLVLVAGGNSRCDDIFSGYFGVERKLFMKIYDANKKRFVGEGYKVLFDFLKCIRKGSISIGEVPYTFSLRREGKSKASAVHAFALLKSFVS